MPVVNISLADSSIYDNDSGNPTDGELVRTDLQTIITKVNAHESTIVDVTENATTLAGAKTFSSNIKVNGIDERTSASGVTVDGVLLKDAGITLTDAGELTIATGAITSTGSYHTVDTESDAASDDLDTINGGAAGRILFVQAENGARTVVLKHNTGNIYNPVGADISLDDEYKGVLLQYSAALSKWVIFSVTSDLDAAVITSPSSGDLISYNGSNWVNQAGKLSNLSRFTSSDQTITSGGLLTLAHGLGAAPVLVRLYLVNQTTEGGWATNDVLAVDINNNGDNTNNKCTSVYVDATNVYVRFTNTASAFSIGNKSTGAALGITNGNWKLRVGAWS